MIKLNLQNRLLLTIFIPLTVLFFVLSWQNYTNTYEQLLEQKRQATKNYISIAEGIYQKKYKELQEGKITEEQAKQNVHNAISEIRYGDGNGDYFWVNDTRPFMVTQANKIRRNRSFNIPR